MSSRLTLDVRMIGAHSDIEGFIASMNKWLSRDGFQLAKQPIYKASRKEPADTLAYTEWLTNQQ